MTLRTAVVGGGVVSGVHLSGLERNPRTELVAICDLDEDVARRIAREHGIRAFFDVEEMLDELELDWVHVCTPVQTHLPVAKTVIDHGIPVMIEKPITETYAEFEELAAYAEERGVIVSEKHNHDFDPVMRAAMEKVRDGELGRVRGVDLLYTGETAPDAKRRGPWSFELAGGEFEEGLPHPLYVLLRAGGYPRSEDDVSAQTSLVGDYDADFDYDGTQVQYVSDDGALCSATILSDTIPVRQLIIHGEETSLTADLTSQTLIEHDRDYKSSSVARALNNVDQIVDRTAGTIQNVRSVLERKRDDSWETARQLNAHYYQNDAESRALEAGDPDMMPVPLSESRWTMRLMQEIRDAARDDRDRHDPHPVEDAVEQRPQDSS